MLLHSIVCACRCGRVQAEFSLAEGWEEELGDEKRPLDG